MNKTKVIPHQRKIGQTSLTGLVLKGYPLSTLENKPPNWVKTKGNHLIRTGKPKHSRKLLVDISPHRCASTPFVSMRAP